MNKPKFITNNDFELLKKKYTEDELHGVIDKINSNYPVQYLIGNVSFYGYEIIVKEGALIPRFETEELVEKTIKLLKKYNMEDIDVLEVGTGTGCIPIVLKKEMPRLKITTIDKSINAINIAKENIKNQNVDITILNEDLFKFKPTSKYSLLISNPPYIKEDLVIDPKCRYEPQMAIYADHNGCIFYEYIIDNAKDWLTKKSIIAFEIGEEQGTYLKEYASKKFKNAIISIEKDLSGRDRFLFIINE